MYNVLGVMYATAVYSFVLYERVKPLDTSAYPAETATYVLRIFSF